MMMFQTPPSTQYDLRFMIVGIPVRVHPLFWLITLLLGSSGNALFIPLWIIAVFVSILAHELGHALAFRRYGLHSHIVLHFGGGLTIPDSSWGGSWSEDVLAPRQQVFISLAGPLAGFFLSALLIAGVKLTGGTVLITWLLGVIPLPVSPLLTFGGSVLRAFISMMLWVNIFWGLINLLPVFPLDGGQVARNILIQYDPWGGVRRSLWVSTVTGGLLAIMGLLAFGSVYMAVLFGLLAFQSYQALQVRY